MTLNRRFPLRPPRVVGRAWNETARELQEYLDSLFESNSGIPAGFASNTPLTILVGGTPSPGNLIAGWMASDAQLVTAAPTVVGALANAGVIGTSTTPARENHQHKRDVRVKLNGVDLATRNALNFIAALGITDDAGNDEVDIDLAAIVAAASGEDAMAMAFLGL